MLQFISEPTNVLLQYIKDDPVRPDLPIEFRVSPGRFVVVMLTEDKPDAIVCVSFHTAVPADLVELCGESAPSLPEVAIFYTIWSYKPGSAAGLLINTVQEIKKQYPSVKRFVTFSPKTPMARRFHLKNGASIFRENNDSVNYEYML